jgi:tetratricopeptide (TPR) repeat protein
VLLNRAAIYFAGIIETRPAKALVEIVEVQTALVSSRLYESEFLTCFHRHLLDLTRERYGQQHSLTKLLMHILRMELDVEMMQHMYQSFLSMTISNLKGRRTSDLWQWYLELADSFERSGQYRKAEGLLLDAVNSFDSETSQKENAKTRCSFDLAGHYIWYQQEMDDEAERILIEIREAGTDEITGEVDPYYAHFAASGLGCLAEKRGENEAAVSFYRLEIQAAYDEWGVDSFLGMKAAAYLAEYLWRLGREEEAIEAESLSRLTDEFSELDLE